MGGETRRAKSLRIGVHHANGVVWGPVYRTRLRKTTRAEFMTYVWIALTSMSAHTSWTLTTLWYELRRTCGGRRERRERSEEEVSERVFSLRFQTLLVS